MNLIYSQVFSAVPALHAGCNVLSQPVYVQITCMFVLFLGVKVFFVEWSILFYPLNTQMKNSLSVYVAHFV